MKSRVREIEKSFQFAYIKIVYFIYCKCNRYFLSLQNGMKERNEKRKFVVKILCSYLKCTLDFDYHSVFTSR